MERDGLTGITFLREMLDWLNARTETKNEDKSPIQLMNEYKKYLLSLR